MEEQIKPIKGFPFYFVSNLGKIYTEYWGPRKELKLQKNKSGYLYCNIYKKHLGAKSTRHYLRVHRLVYGHFIGELEPTLVVDHKDDNKRNNHWTNLQQLTHKQNIQKYWKKRKENEKN